MKIKQGQYVEVIREHFLSTLKEIKNEKEFIEFAIYEKKMFPFDFELFNKVVKNNFSRFVPVLDKLYLFYSLL